MFFEDCLVMRKKGGGGAYWGMGACHKFVTFKAK